MTDFNLEVFDVSLLLLTLLKCDSFSLTFCIAHFKLQLSCVTIGACAHFTLWHPRELVLLAVVGVT